MKQTLASTSLVAPSGRGRSRRATLSTFARCAAAAVIFTGLTSSFADADAGAPPLQRSVTITANDERLRDVLLQVFREAGAKLEFDIAGLEASGLDLDQKVRVNVVDTPVWQVVHKLVDRRKHA